MSDDHLSPDLRAFIATLERNEGIPFSREDTADEEEDVVVVNIEGTDTDIEVPVSLWDASCELASARGQTMGQYIASLIEAAIAKAGRKH